MVRSAILKGKGRVLYIVMTRIDLHTRYFCLLLLDSNGAGVL